MPKPLFKVLEIIDTYMTFENNFFQLSAYYNSS